jgi:hypothetical protein
MMLLRNKGGKNKGGLLNLSERVDSPLLFQIVELSFFFYKSPPISSSSSGNGVLIAISFFKRTNL